MLLVLNCFDVRRYLPEPYNTSDYAISLYFTICDFSIDLPASFWDVAKALNMHYKTRFQQQGGKEAEENLKFLLHDYNALWAVIWEAKGRALPVCTDAIITSWGVFEKYCQRSYSGPSVHVDIEDVSPQADMVFGQPVLMLYTFRDQLRLVHSYNEAYDDTDGLREFYDYVKKVLEEELLASI